MRNLAMIVMTGLLLSACGPDFAPYNRLESLRVLGIRAEPPTPAFGETSVLSALVYAPPSESVSWRWSWCPFTRGALEGYACAVEQSALQAAIDANLPAGATFELPPFDLGSRATASLAHVFLPELLEPACRELLADGLPAGVAAPDCSRGLPVNLRLEARAGDEVIVAVRELFLRGASEGGNQNPEIAELLAGEPGRASAPLALDGSTRLARGEPFELTLVFDEAVAETYLAEDGSEQKETLVFTWFVEGGETEVTRTALAAGRSDFADATRNEWTTPTRAELSRDSAQLFVVVRDDRGGMGWLERRIQLGGD